MVRAPLTRARGVALVVAMLVAALAAAVVATLASGQSQWLRTVELRREQVQAQALVLAGLSWARQVVYDDARSGPYDHLGEPWALPLPPTPIERGSVEGSIVDAQGLVNVNDVAAGGAVETLAHRALGALLARVGVASTALPAIADWIDADATPRENGSEDGDPRGGAPLVANAGMTRAAEMSRVRGIGEAAFAGIAPFVTALPARTPINVNTAPPDVLGAVVGLSGDALASLVASRAQKPFTTVAEFRARLPAGATMPDETALSVATEFFIATVVARQGETVARGRALLRRRPGAWPTVVWQTLE